VSFPVAYTARSTPGPFQTDTISVTIGTRLRIWAYGDVAGGFGLATAPVDTNAVIAANAAYADIGVLGRGAAPGAVPYVGVAGTAFGAGAPWEFSRGGLSIRSIAAPGRMVHVDMSPGQYAQVILPMYITAQQLAAFGLIVANSVRGYEVDEDGRVNTGIGQAAAGAAATGTRDTDNAGGVTLTAMPGTAYTEARSSTVLSVRGSFTMPSGAVAIVTGVGQVAIWVSRVPDGSLATGTTRPVLSRGYGAVLGFLGSVRQPFVNVVPQFLSAYVAVALARMKAAVATVKF